MFAGGATAEALDRIDPGASHAAESLAEKSLALWTDTELEPRLSLMDTVRQFAEDQAIDTSEWQTLQARHATWVSDGAKLAGLAYFTSDQTKWARRIELELANIRTALEWAFAHGETAIASTIVNNVNPYMEHRGYYSEGREWARRALQMPDIAPRARIRLLHSVTFLSFRLTDYVAGDVSFREAVALAEEIGAEDLLAIVLNNMARSPWFRARPDEIEPMLECALELHRRHKNRHRQAISVSGLGTIAALRGNYERAFELDLQAIEIARDSQIPMLILYLTVNYAVELAVGGRIGEAEPWFQESIKLAIELRDPTIESAGLHGLALLEVGRGNVNAAFANLVRSGDISRMTGNRQAFAMAIHELGRVEWLRGNLAEAAKHIYEGIEIFVADGVERWTIELIDSAAAVLLSAGERESAARLVGYADEARRLRSIGRMRLEDAFLETLLLNLAETLGDESRDQLMDVGRTMSDSDALELVLAMLKMVADGPGLRPQATPRNTSSRLRMLNGTSVFRSW